MIHQETLAQLTPTQLTEKISDVPTIEVQELRFSDLYQPRRSCHGIYFFVSPDFNYYFGKATKRCIADRVGAHFDSRKDSFLNSFLKKVANSTEDEELQQVYRQILHWRFGALFVEGNDPQLCKLIELAERVLIMHYRNDGERCFNGCRRQTPYPNRSLAEILEC